MKKRIVAISLVSVLLSGCTKLEELGLMKSRKEKVDGKREVVLQAYSQGPELKAETDVKVTLPQSIDLKEWPQARQNSSHMPPHVKTAAKVEPLWRKSLGFKSNTRQRLLSEPVIADGKLFIYTPDSFVSAFNAEDGSSLWSIYLKPEKKQDAILGGGIAYNNGVLYVSTPFAELFAVDVATGKPKWSVKTSGPLRSAPTLADGRVYVVTINNELYAIDHNSGDVLWQHSGIMEFAGLLGGCSPACEKDVVIAPYTSGEVYALKADNGFPLWTESLASVHRTDSNAGMPHIHAKPVIDSGNVYIVSNAGRMACFDLRNGAIVWEKEIGGASTPLIAGEFLYLVTSDNDLVCLTKKDGLVCWTLALPMWKNQAKRKDRIVWNGPLMAGGRLLLTGSKGRLMAVNPENGEWDYEYNVPGSVMVAPVAVNGMVYVVTDSGQLVAFK